MSTSVPPDLLRAVWEYPLFDALCGGRTQRFGLGFEMAQGPCGPHGEMAPPASDGAFRPRKIRRADQSDLAVVQGISADAYIAAYVPVLGYIPLPAEEDYRPRIERGEVWLLACGDAYVGVAVLEERRDHLLVYSIAVRPTEQGRGHGRALLDFADQRAIAVGLEVIRLYTNVRMEKNIALYRRHGYAETGTRPHPSRAGEVLVDMVRAVTPSAS